MKKYSRRIALVALPVVFGMLIGLGGVQTVRADGQQGKDVKSAKTKKVDAEKPRKAKMKMKKPKRKVQRFGSVIELRPEKKDYYNELHANTWPSVLKQIRKSNIRNYSIYLAELEGKLYLFAYFEYIGDDFEADMKKLGEDPETRRWWKETDPCQKRLAGTPEGQQWLSIPEVFHTN